MPILSAFTSMGLFRLSGQPSLGQTIYEATVSATGNSYPVGSHLDVSLYARAMGTARANVVLERAQNQALPEKCLDLLPERELEYGLAPGPLDTIPQRQAALASRLLLPGGATFQNVSTLLSKLLGKDFVSYVPNTTIETFPSSPGSGPSNFQTPFVTRKLVRTLGTIVPISISPTQTVAVEPADPLDKASVIDSGDVIVIDADNASLAERVTVASAVVSGGVNSITVPCVKGHEAGAIVTTAPWPLWISSTRHSVITISDAAASDANTIAKIHAIMAEVARGVSTWAITTTSQSGGFFLDVSHMDLALLNN